MEVTEFQPNRRSFSSRRARAIQKAKLILSANQLHSAIVDEQRRLRVTREYLEYNRSLGNDLVFRLGHRGFYSEINIMLAGMLFCIFSQRRFWLLVDEFQVTPDGDPVDFFKLFNFPSELTISKNDAVKVNDHAGINDRSALILFNKIRDTINFLQTHGKKIETPFTAKPRDAFYIASLLAKSLLVRCGPDGKIRTIVDSHLDAQTFVPPNSGRQHTFHVRRGDKTLGYITERKTDKGIEKHRVIEGEATPLDFYIETCGLDKTHGHTIFIMTDDYSIYEEAQRTLHNHHVFTLCQPNERGYDQSTQDQLTAPHKEAALHRLLLETQIASRSDVIVAGQLSNVAKFMRLWSIEGQSFVPVDRQKEWQL